MPYFATESLTPETRLSESHQKQIYNGLDCCVTLEVFEELDAKHGACGQPWSTVPVTYNFERALQAPYLEMMQRGFRVDETARREAARELNGRLDALQIKLDKLANAVWDRPLNPRSSTQLKQFFYTPAGLNLPEVWISKKGVRSLSCNREALEKLEQYLYAQPFCSSILALRDIGKQLDVFEQEIDRDCRFRTSYNIAGTETGRPSSSTNAYGTGGNAQNIAKPLRYVFTADPGWKICNIDLEQTEARDVGYFVGCLFEDWRYLDACESGDVHTANTRLVWPELRWTGDIKRDRQIAEAIFYRDFTYRDMAKRGGHLTNYDGTAWTMGRSLKIPQSIADEFQARYCRGRAESRNSPAIEPAYPSIPKWWAWTAEQIQTRGWIETPFGFRRTFFGRPGDDSTLREAIAFLPQSTTAQRTNLALWRIWHYMPEVQVLAQTYDSVTFQYQERGQSYENDVVGRALELMRVEQRRPNGQLFIVPGEAKIGWNWGDAYREADAEKAIAKGKRPQRLNPDGLIKWSASRPDTRSRTSILDRIAA